jgi:hypothetical protein
MRYSDIKSSIQLAENKAANAGLEAQHAMHDLDAIAKAVPAMDNEKRAAFVKNIQAIAQKVRDFVSKNIENRSQLQTNQPNSTVEAVGDVQNKLGDLKNIEQQNKDAEAALQMLRDDIAMIESDQGLTDEQKTKFLSSLNVTLDANVKSSETLRAARDSAMSERDEAINFVKEVTGVLVTLGNKVQGFREDEDTSEWASKERAAYKKMAVNAQKFTKTLKQALFGKILDMQEGGDVTGQEIKEFLEACVRGDVINMLDVIQQPQGNIKNHVNSKYQKVFDVFVEENIFSYAPGTTSGAIGPGEMALSMMGNPAEKGKKGDLKIGKEEVEIKASAKTGGRFNSKSIAKATTGWAIWAKGINQIMQNAPEDATVSVTQKDGSEKLVPAREYNGNRYNVIKNKAKEGSKYNWNSSGLKNLNIEVLQPYANKRETYELFESTIKALVQNYDKLSKPATNRDGTPNKHHKPFNPGELIADAVNDDGTINIGKMNIAYSKIAYSSYHLADGITTVMLLRTDNLNYVIFRDADDLVQQMGTDKIITGGGFNWNDDQQTPTPGYIAKA